MKCIECAGSGLKDQNNVCPICEGFGSIQSHQLGEPNEVSEAVEAEVNKVEKPKRKSLISKFKSKK